MKFLANKKTNSTNEAKSEYSVNSWKPRHSHTFWRSLNQTFESVSVLVCVSCTIEAQPPAHRSVSLVGKRNRRTVSPCLAARCSCSTPARVLTRTTVVAPGYKSVCVAPLASIGQRGWTKRRVAVAVTVTGTDGAFVTSRATDHAGHHSHASNHCDCTFEHSPSQQSTVIRR